MREPFIITGLPRSRTAWLARVATIEDWSICEHEPSLEMDGPSDLVDFFLRSASEYVGVSDSHLAQALPMIFQAMTIKTLIVLRDPIEVTQSLERLGLSPRMIGPSLQGISTVMGSPLVRTIKYQHLSNSYKVRKALQWLMPDAKISLRDIEALQGQKIEVDIAANRQKWLANEDRRSTRNFKRSHI